MCGIENRKRVGHQTQRCKDGSWTIATTMWRRSKITTPILGEILLKGLTPRCKAVKTDLVKKYVRELQQKTRNIISMSMSALSLSLSLSLSHLTTFYLSLSSQRGRLPFHKLFLSSLYLRTKTVVCVFVTFSHGDVTTRIRLTRIHPLDTWWGKCLCGVVVLQTSIETVPLQPSIWCGNGTITTIYQWPSG